VLLLVALGAQLGQLEELLIASERTPMMIPRNEGNQSHD
jgi:hypothetical protein